MKDIEVNPLNQRQRQLLQLGVILLLGVFLIGYFVMINRVKNTTVYLQNDTLQIFDDTIRFKYPDKINMHYPYLLVAKPEEQKTEIYNLKEKKMEKEFGAVVLDYSYGKVLANKGKTTFLDGQNLGVLCEDGVILEYSTLCVANHELLAIVGDDALKSIVYTTKYIITDLYESDDTYYLGEIDPETNKSYIVIEGKEIPVPNIVSVIYDIQAKPYFASFKSVLNKGNAEYFEIVGNQVVKQDDNKIVFYK